MIPGVGHSKSRDHSQSVLYLKVVSVLDTFQPPRLPPDVYYARLVQVASPSPSYDLFSR